MLPTLKPLLYLPPLLATAGMAFWIHSRLQPSQPAAEVAPLVETHAAESSRAIQATGAGVKESPHSDPVELAIEKRDWKAIAVLFGQARQAQTKLERDPIYTIADFLKTLDVADFREAAEKLGRDNTKITSLDFEGALIDQWVKKDPVTALDFYADRLIKPGFGCNQSLQQGLQAWAKTDFPKAVAWLNDLTAKGGFDSTAANGRNSVWMAYKAALIHGGMTVDFEAVKHEIEDCSYSEKTELLQNPTFYRLTAEEQSSYGKLCREFGDESRFRSALDGTATRALVAEGADLEGVSSIFDRMGATAAERGDIASGLVNYYFQSVSRNRDFSIKDLTTLRVWLEKEGVKDPDRYTGGAIGAFGSSRGGLDTAFEWLESYRQNGAGESLTYGFLRWPGVWKREADCRALLETLHNEKWKKEILKDVAPKTP